MTNIGSNFNQILKFAREYGLPEGKKRAILREYLQTKILNLLYNQKASANLFFVGGTALRLLHGLDRFSEDLDFDAVDLNSKEIRNLLLDIVDRLKRENLAVNFYKNTTAKKDYYEFRFPTVLSDTGISSDPEEKLMIKMDFEFFWRGQKREIIFLNRYGFLSNIVTKSRDQFLVEKLAAFLRRKETQARDIYDIVWLLSGGAKIDLKFAVKNKLDKNLSQLAKEKFLADQKKLSFFKASLRPFLLDEENAFRIDFFPRLLV